MSDSPSDETPAEDTDAEVSEQAAPRAAEEATPDTETEAEVRRRWLIRLLVALGLGLPIAIEARTFYELFTSYLFGDGPNGTATATSTPTATGGVGVGEELLPSTQPVETVEVSEITVIETGWQYAPSVDVQNTGDVPYALRLGGVETESGARISGSASTGRIEPGETATVSETWELERNDRPQTVSVIALTYDTDETRTTNRDVRLARVTVRG
jgi:hypothetical protein